MQEFFCVQAFCITWRRLLCHSLQGSEHRGTSCEL